MVKILQQQKKTINPAVYWLTALSLLLLADIWLVFINGNTTFDNKVFAAINPHISDSNTSLMKGITFLGNHKFLIPANLLLIALLLLFKKGNLAWRVAAIALSSLALKYGLKELFHRPRPDDPLVPGITNFSFPSGHALMSVAFFGLLIYLAIKYISNKPLRTAVIILSAALILLIGFSRIYLRVHYATDVIAGFCIGICWLYFCMWFTERMSSRNAGL